MNGYKDHPALILGMFETGLGVGRSLGREGIKVFGFDSRKDIGFYSVYIKARICSHPIIRPKDLLEELIEFSKSQLFKPALFITSDDFLKFVSKNQIELKQHFLFNLPSSKLIDQISNKFDQFILAQNAGISLPATHKIRSESEKGKLLQRLKFPVFIKAVDVNEWRKHFGGTNKGFVIKDKTELNEKVSLITEKKVEIIIQEIIPGPDDCHFKYCTYIGKDGRILLEFTLKKIRQNPIHFGIGVLVESLDYSDLISEGRRFINNIGYRGVGSAEFKFDKRDGKLKLIELNPRYWQQNSLPTRCGMNFALIDYLEVTGQNPEPITTFTKGIKWVNQYSDFSSFLQYRKTRELSFFKWRKSLKGEKVYSDFAWDDIVPFFYEFRFGLKIIRLPIFIYKMLFK